MAFFRCKMCGGDLAITEGMTVCECEYCGSRQTVPSMDSEKKITLFSRANRLLAACEFDKAYSLYENIVSEFPEEAEAYWGLILCKYGIEYVDDPKTGKKIPTCHRSSFENVMEDEDFDKVMDHADAIAVSVYREEARAIESLRKGILEVSAKEEPYDIFICYKETDDHGDRTLDSVLAQDVYKTLTEEGYRVFFSRISLEDKLGTAYEPYIFAALNSARVMLVIGTSYENFTAVWVKNEWGRFLQLIERGEKKTLIPCFKDIDAYDIPKEFRHLQAQDLGKVGAVQDLLRGITKIIPRQTGSPQAEQTATNKPPAFTTELSEKEKRRTGPALIRTIQLVGTNDSKDFFPAGPSTNRVDRARFSCMSMQIILNKPIGYQGTAKYKYIIYDDFDNVISEILREVATEPNYDKFAVVVYVVGKDGSKLRTGNYRVEAWIDDSQVYEYNFMIVDSSEDISRAGNRRQNDNTAIIRMLIEEKSNIETEIDNLSGFFSGKKRKQLEARLASINEQIRGLL